MKLLILPGAGSRKIKPYQAAYALLEKLAVEAGYSRIDCSIVWNGQESAETPFSFPGAVELASRKIAAFDAEGEPFDLLGRSIGGVVAAACVAPKKWNHLKRVIFWSPSPYWNMWEKYVQYRDRSLSWNREKGVHVDPNYFEGLAPFESLLRRVQYEWRLATGTEDEYCGPAFAEYLRQIGGGTGTVGIVAGAGHVVTAADSETVIQSYFEALFGGPSAASCRKT